LTGNLSWYRGVVFPGALRTKEASVAESSARAVTGIRSKEGEAEEAERDWQCELVLRRCLVPGGCENKGNVRRREQRESCHGEQTEQVGEADEAELVCHHLG
jgi:hypothetical protein